MKLYRYLVIKIPKPFGTDVLIRATLKGFTLADSLEEARKNVEEHYSESLMAKHNKFEICRVEEVKAYECTRE